MRKNIHPRYFDDAQVTCSCGNTFTVGSTQEKIHVELCNKCHPFYTGQQKFVDTASRIEKFEAKKKLQKDRREKIVKKKEDSAPQTLREMLEALKKT